MNHKNVACLIFALTSSLNYSMEFLPNQLLIEAIKNRNHESVKNYLMLQCNTTNMPATWNALAYAAHLGQKDLVLQLIQAGLPVNERFLYCPTQSISHTAAAIAKNNGHYELKQILRSYNGFFNAVCCNNLVKVQSYLKSTIIVNARYMPNQKTVLHKACEYGYYWLVKTLVEHGASVNALDKNNKSPLYYAASDKKKGPQASRNALIHFLLTQQADYEAALKKARAIKDKSARNMLLEFKKIVKV